MTRHYCVNGAGLGLRRELMAPLKSTPLSKVKFLEIAPENWMHIGGAFAKDLRYFTERYDVICHGLSLSLGSPSPLDEAFVRDVGEFMKKHRIKLYSEHLSYCSDHGHLYDLMPIPFTEEAVDYVAARIRRVQEILGQKIAVENVSYYAAPLQQMSEIDFINAVIKKADCLLHIDINNIYVNSVNHRYDAADFMLRLPSEKIAYAHIAGHYDEAPDLLVDTHGNDVKNDVWDLLALAYQRFGVFPTLLERDFNIPPLSVLQGEINKIAQLQEQADVCRVRTQPVT